LAAPFINSPSRNHRPLTAPLPLGRPDGAGFAPTSVEEHREKVAGAAGETRTAIRRRPGVDRVKMKSTLTRTAPGQNGRRGTPAVMTPSKDSSGSGVTDQTAFDLGSAGASPSPIAIAASSDGSADAGGRSK
jgi:hypothetical protein